MLASHQCFDLADTLCRGGVADAELAKKKAERGRKRKAGEDADESYSKKRSRSILSDSSDSASTISTDLSHSPSRRVIDGVHTGQSQLLSTLGLDRKRRRSRSISSSYTSHSSRSEPLRGQSHDRVEDGALQRENGVSGADKVIGTDRRHRRHSRYSFVSSNSEMSGDGRRVGASNGADRSKRRRHSSRSPVDRGRDRALDRKQPNRRTRSPLESRDRSQVARARKSMTPALSRRDDGSIHEDYARIANPGNIISTDNHHFENSSHGRPDHIRSDRQQPDAQHQRDRRSLSPFSKRLVLTQAMNMGR